MSKLDRPRALDSMQFAAAVPVAETPPESGGIKSPEGGGFSQDASREVLPRPEKWPARISMTASREMKRQLEAARIEDGIEVTARLRAMITLWQEDVQLRVRIDELAKSLR